MLLVLASYSQKNSNCWLHPRTIHPLRRAHGFLFRSTHGLLLREGPDPREGLLRGKDGHCMYNVVAVNTGRSVENLRSITLTQARAVLGKDGPGEVRRRWAQSEADMADSDGEEFDGPGSRTRFHLPRHPAVFPVFSSAAPHYPSLLGRRFLCSLSAIFTTFLLPAFAPAIFVPCPGCFPSASAAEAPTFHALGFRVPVASSSSS